MKPETLKALKDSLGDLRVTCKELLDTAETEERALNADEQTIFDQNETRINELKQEIRRLEFVRSEQVAAEAEMTPTTTTTVATSDPHAADAARRTLLPATARRVKKLVAFRGDHAEEDAYTSGHLLLAGVLGRRDSIEWCQRKGLANELRSLGTGVGTKGGFLTPDPMAQAIIDLREEYGVARQECSIYPMSSDTQTIPRRTGGITVYSVGDNTAITASDKSWDKVTLVANKWGALTQVSSELNEDAIISLTDDLAREFAYAFAVKEDACLWDGDGTATYSGITGIRTKMLLAAHRGGVYESVGGDIFSEITAADLAGTMGICPTYAHNGGNAKWYCSGVFWAGVFERLLAAGGGNTIASLAAGAPKMYMGYPVVISPSMPAGATTDYTDLIICLFGDMRMATTLGDRRGFELSVSNEVYFAEDAIGVKGTTRFDINAHDLGTATVAGPLVGLEGKTG